jgi:hypothetical protein
MRSAAAIGPAAQPPTGELHVGERQHMEQRAQREDTIIKASVHCERQSAQLQNIKHPYFLPPIAAVSSPVCKLRKRNLGRNRNDDEICDGRHYRLRDFVGNYLFPVALLRRINLNEHE